MAAMVRIREETPGGGRSEASTLEFAAERITIRELIRGYAYQGVRDSDREVPGRRRVPDRVAGEGTAPGRRGGGGSGGRPIGWESRFEAALKAFETRKVVVLVGDRQVEGLDEEIVLGPGVGVTFLRLLPLAGG